MTFLTALRARYGTRPFAAKKVRQDMEADQGLAAALPSEELLGALKESTGASFSIRLGRFFENHVNARYGAEGLHVERAGEYQNSKLWRIRTNS